MVPVLLLQLIFSTLPAVASASNDASAGEVLISTKAKTSLVVADHLKRQDREEQSSSLTSKLAFITKLAERDAAHNITRTEAENGALELIKTLIQNMYVSMVSQHGEDKNETARLLESISNCKNHLNYNNETSGPVHDTYNGSYWAMHACLGSLTGAEATYVSSCTSYHNTLQSGGLPPCLNDLAQKVGDLDWVNIGICLETFNAWLAPVMVLKQECDAADVVYKAKQLECVDLQNAYETHVCSWSAGLDNSCQAMDQCRASEIPLRDGALPQIRESEEARKADFTASRRALCLFGVFDAENDQKQAALQQCIDANYDPIEFYINTTEPTPNRPNCPQVDLLPGHADYFSGTYNQYPLTLASSSSTVTCSTSYVYTG